MRFGGAIAALVLMAAACAEAQALEFSGDLSLEGQWYPESPAFPGQRSGTVGLVAEPTLYEELGEATSFTLAPFYRYDSADSRRTHADLREAYLLTYGDWGEDFWELRLGFDRVFWGVAELYNLVDIVNQVDLVEHPRNRPKLGQPMAHLTISGDWGIAEAFVLPYHRKRIFPGRTGRQRSAYLIDEDARYESGAEERHVDVAFRYSRSVDLVDFGLSAFVGTSREPSFLFSQQAGPSPNSDARLIAYYEQIQQFGIDAQLTTEPWLYKLEAIHRRGARNLLGWEENYSALIFGMERTLYALFDTRADITVLAESLYDGRGRRSTSAWADDLFVAGSIAFNDVEDTQLLVGLLADLRHDYRALNLELKRRLSGSWSMRLEGIANLSADPQDLTYDGRRDSFLGAGLTYSF